MLGNCVYMLTKNWFWVFVGVLALTDMGVSVRKILGIYQPDMKKALEALEFRMMKLIEESVLQGTKSVEESLKAFKVSFEEKLEKKMDLPPKKKGWW
ncbi:unnamed protein product [Cochlearia groenlandica]